MSAVPVWPEALLRPIPHVVLDGVVHAVSVLDKVKWGHVRDTTSAERDEILRSAPVRILCEDSRTRAPWRDLPRTVDAVTCLECLTYMAGRHGA